MQTKNAALFPLGEGATYPAVSLGLSGAASFLDVVLPSASIAASLPTGYPVRLASVLRLAVVMARSASVYVGPHLGNNPSAKDHFRFRLSMPGLVDREKLIAKSSYFFDVATGLEKGAKTTLERQAPKNLSIQPLQGDCKSIALHAELLQGGADLTIVRKQGRVKEGRVADYSPNLLRTFSKHCCVAFAASHAFRYPEKVVIHVRRRKVTEVGRPGFGSGDAFKGKAIRAT